ncbi:sigma factor-like helix-turn-helix DNA-binding protein [Neopoerus faecalis]|uniref:sigma factor-like helix-turn-helix DNA-binding protein n=1 Tax=Neopoerus faecalis TaxID=3032125 RepID=UPI00256FBE3D|nr:sigma factor-like helix-turn-helix DNA-binding protein [Neopoerus faecalis]
MVNKAYLKADYEATKHLAGLTMRQKELLEAWLYTGQTMGQIALRYGINQSTVSRTVNRAAEKITKIAYWHHRQRRRT